MGITYYSRLTTAPFVTGTTDSTKKCSLTGAEIDNNFNFLRGYDVDELSYDEKNKQLILKRINGNIEKFPFDAEQSANKTTTVDENSTDKQYPSAKAVYDTIIYYITQSEAASVTNAKLGIVNTPTSQQSGAKMTVEKGETKEVILDLTELEIDCGDY